jgi:hypothetical protein
MIHALTFADCEKELGTDYHEVTIQRRENPLGPPPKILTIS